MPPKKLELSSFSVGGADHDAFVNAVKVAANASVEEFPKTLEKLKELFREREPIGIVAAAAIYGLYGRLHRSGQER